MKIKLLTALSFCAFALHQSSAQVSAYSFTQAFTQYGAPFTGTNYIGTYNQDDEINNLSLPFTFTFNGTPYNNVDVATNGFMTFASGATGFETDPISDATTSEVLSPLGTDLVAGMAMTGNIAAGSNIITGVSFISGVSVGDSIEDFFGDFAIPFPKVVSVGGGNITLNANALVTSSAYDFFMPNGAIRSQVTGTSPTRTFTIEYRNFTRFEFNEAINMKVRLHETINKIEFCYGPVSSGTLANNVEIGLKGSGLSDFANRRVQGATPYIASQTGTLVTDNAVFSPSKFPTGGLTYGWQPPCPVPTFTVSQSTPSICLGQSVTLIASGATNYSFVGVGGNTTHVVSPTVTTNYTVIGRIGLCTSTVNVLQVVDVYPTITVSGGNSTLCAGSNATLTANGASTYSWTNFGPGAQIVVTPSATTIYSVSGSNGVCGSQTIHTINVTALPNVQVSQPSATVCINQPVTLTAAGATTYSWNTGATSAQITVTQSVATTYTVTGTSGACAKKVIVTQYVKDCSGLSENSLNNILLFPNPLATQLTVRNESGSGLNITVSDITGKVIFNRSSDKDLVIATENWSAGIYMISISNGEQTSVRKIVKQ